VIVFFTTSIATDAIGQGKVLAWIPIPRKLLLCSCCAWFDGSTAAPFDLSQFAWQLDFGKTAGHQKPTVIRDDVNVLPARSKKLQDSLLDIAKYSINAGSQFASSVMAFTVNVAKLTPGISFPRAIR
jgi:hypothetical protein